MNSSLIFYHKKPALYSRHNFDEFEEDFEFG